MRPRGADRRADSVSDDVRELATKLRQALRPFAYQSACLVPPDGEPAVDDAEHFRFRNSLAAISAGHCRAAAKALGEGGQ